MRQDLAASQREVQESLGILERLKPRITRRYERYIERLRAREGSKSDTQPARGDHHEPATLEPSTRPVEAATHRGLAVQIAQEEFTRRELQRAAADPDPVHADDSLSRRLQALHERVVDADTGKRPGLPPRRGEREGEKERNRDRERDGSRSQYRYPTVPRQSQAVPALESGDDLSAQAPTPSPRTLDLIPPLVPAKVSNGEEKHDNTPTSVSPTPPSLPPRPASITATNPEPGSRTLTTSTPPPRPIKTPIADTSASPSTYHPSAYTFKPSAYLESGTPLRTVFISPALRSAFLSLAAPNTARNLETCGILAGTLIANAFFVSRLIVPPQTSTSDTCEMTAEGETCVFDYCDAADLLVLGWIHTHPSQSCFLSSRDVHTHAGFQVMLPESVALVCAPAYNPSFGVFRLTDPPGLKAILACSLPGLFHPHTEREVYTDADSGVGAGGKDGGKGHVFEAKGLRFEVVDLRMEA